MSLPRHAGPVGQGLESMKIDGYLRHRRRSRDERNGTEHEDGAHDADW